MSSSISSSEVALVQPIPRRRRGTAVGLLLVLLFVELVTRAWLLPASKDLNRIAEYPALARSLMASPGVRIAIVGNSAAERGVDPAQLARLLSSPGRPVAAELFAADSAEIHTLYWLMERAFFHQGLNPDVVILNFFDRNLEDGAPLDVGRLARSFTGPEDWPEVLRHDLRGLDERAELVLSYFSAAFAARHRLKERVLTLLPGYKGALGRINDVNFEHEKRGRFASPDQPHEGLRRFLRRAREQHLRVCFIAYPKQDHYEISSEARRLITEAGMPLVDLRQNDALADQHYADNIHLNESGRRIYTTSLARAVAESCLR